MSCSPAATRAAPCAGAGPQHCCAPSRLPPYRQGSSERWQAGLEAAQDGANHRKRIEGPRAAGATGGDRCLPARKVDADIVSIKPPFLTTGQGHGFKSPAAFGNAMADFAVSLASSR